MYLYMYMYCIRQTCGSTLHHAELLCGIHRTALLVKHVQTCTCTWYCHYKQGVGTHSMPVAVTSSVHSVAHMLWEIISLRNNLLYTI